VYRKFTGQGAEKLQLFYYVYNNLLAGVLPMEDLENEVITTQLLTAGGSHFRGYGLDAAMLPPHAVMVRDIIATSISYSGVGAVAEMVCSLTLSNEGHPLCYWSVRCKTTAAATP
jgi:hypothetical protein